LLLTTWVGFWSWVRSKLWACHIYLIFSFESPTIQILNLPNFTYKLHYSNQKKKNTVTIYVAQKFKCSTWIGSSTVSLSYSITWKHFTGWESGQLDVLYASICCLVVWHKMAGCTLFWPRLSGQHVKHNGYPTVIESISLQISIVVFHGMVNLEMPSWYYQGNLSTTLQILEQNGQHFVPHQNRMTTLSDSIHQVH
jgi:hypothetical protein